MKESADKRKEGSEWTQCVSDEKGKDVGKIKKQGF